MRITSRTRTIAFFITLGALLVGLAIALNVGWIVLNWRRALPLVLGIIFFGVIIAGMVVNTIFLVREVRRNEQQDSFLNAVTHELKTPLTSIRLYLETLQKRPVEEPRRQDFYKLMLEDTDRLLGTVEQVLKASEVRHTGRRNREHIDFTSLARESVDLARLRHNLSHQELSFSAEPAGQITVMGHPEELRTAMANILENAVKYSGAERKIQVTIGTPNLDTVLFSVHDNGIGLSRDEVKRIFKRFYRVPNPAAGRVKGTGLGLFIVRSIARRHGGDALAESAGEGRGSTFMIRLPRVYHV
jgi:signal transduction histidine kinase